MRPSILPLLVAASLIGSAFSSLYPRDHDNFDYFAVHLHPSLPPAQAAEFLGARHEGQIGELADHHTFSVPKKRAHQVDGLLRDARDLRQRRRRRRDTELSSIRNVAGPLERILWSDKLTLKKRLHKRIPPPPPLEKGNAIRQVTDSSKKPDKASVLRQKRIALTLNIDDPIFTDQWHLFNVYEPGNDLNVTGLWLEGITGKGIVSSIVDDGLDMNSNDLKANYFAEGSYDFNDKAAEPRPRLSDDKHGTRCAGEISAVRNDVCGVGVAYDGKVSGIRILSKPISDEDEALAINYGYQQNHIYSCSWGPVDDGKHMDAPGILIQRAMVNGIQKGRDGKGSIYVFAAGNGAASEDNCNYDGYTNSIYSITVGAIDRNNNHPYYSESCSAQLVVTYSSGGAGAIHTTDVGLNQCSTRHGGTSAAGPLVVGVVALVLSARPELTWRDVQYLMVETAIPLNEDDGSWQTTKIGKKFSHDFGYGKVDAWSVVHLAKKWTPVKPQAWLHSPWMIVKHAIPQGDQGLASSFEVTEELVKQNNLERVEHVTVTMNVNHTRRGDLSVELQSPDGITSHLSTPRSGDNEGHGYVDWTFMSVAHWGESGIGKWTVIVKDTAVNDHNGTFIDWQLTLWGESINPNIQKLHPLPDEHDHDHETTIATHISTMSITTGPTKTAAPSAVPTDHIDRPINEKPGDGEPPSLTTKPSSQFSSTTATSTSSPTDLSDNLLPSPFPTFGVSKSTQIWIYGSAALIVAFCAALGIYFWVQRRKRLRNNPRDDYEFEMVPEDESRFPLSGAVAGVGGKGRAQPRRRGGELYDAFAGESDADEDILSDDDDHDRDSRSGSEADEPYHDTPEETVREKWSEKSRPGEEGSS